jgi:hypothetical protein
MEMKLFVLYQFKTDRCGRGYGGREKVLGVGEEVKEDLIQSWVVAGGLGYTPIRRIGEACKLVRLF